MRASNYLTFERYLTIPSQKKINKQKAIIHSTFKARKPWHHEVITVHASLLVFKTYYKVISTVLFRITTFISVTKRVLYSLLTLPVSSIPQQRVSPSHTVAIVCLSCFYPLFMLLLTAQIYICVKIHSRDSIRLRDMSVNNVTITAAILPFLGSLHARHVRNFIRPGGKSFSSSVAKYACNPWASLPSTVVHYN